MEYLSTFSLFLLTSTLVLGKLPDPNLKQSRTSGQTCTISPKLRKIISSARSTSQDIYIEFPSRLDNVKTKPDVIKAADRNEKARIVQKYLETSSNEDHKLLLAGIKLLKLPTASKVNSFWISNSISITAVPPRVMKSLTTIKTSAPCIIHFAPKTRLHSSSRSSTTGGHSRNPKLQQNSAASANHRDSNVAWGVKRIGAPDVWNLGHRGQGINVAITDTGVNHLHESLRSNWDRHWCDTVAEEIVDVPMATACRVPPRDSRVTTWPIDPNGHGTAVASIAVGRFGVGVAPDATWRACRQSDEFGWSTYDRMMACAQWISSVTNRRGLPHVVVNSWGTNLGGNEFFKRAIKVWNDLGIHHVFSTGNKGPNCATVTSPGDQVNAFGVGNLDIYDRPYIGSSRGVNPVQGNLKPDISAPGTDIPVADNNNRYGYTTMTGTSMAAPHVAGAIALILSSESDPGFHLTPEHIRNLIVGYARKPDITLSPQDAVCYRENYINPLKPYPNAAMGAGILDLKKIFAQRIHNVVSRT